MSFEIVKNMKINQCFTLLFLLSFSFLSKAVEFPKCTVTLEAIAGTNYVKQRFGKEVKEFSDTEFITLKKYINSCFKELCKDQGADCRYRSVWKKDIDKNLGLYEKEREDIKINRKLEEKAALIKARKEKQAKLNEINIAKIKRNKADQELKESLESFTKMPNTIDSLFTIKNEISKLERKETTVSHNNRIELTKEVLLKKLHLTFTEKPTNPVNCVLPILELKSRELENIIYFSESNIVESAVTKATTLVACTQGELRLRQGTDILFYKSGGIQEMSPAAEQKLFYNDVYLNTLKDTVIFFSKNNKLTEIENLGKSPAILKNGVLFIGGGATFHNNGYLKETETRSDLIFDYFGNKHLLEISNDIKLNEDGYIVFSGDIPIVGDWKLKEQFGNLKFRLLSSGESTYRMFFLSGTAKSLGAEFKDKLKMQPFSSIFSLKSNSAVSPKFLVLKKVPDFDEYGEEWQSFEMQVLADQNDREILRIGDFEFVKLGYFEQVWESTKIHLWGGLSLLLLGSFGIMFIGNAIAQLGALSKRQYDKRSKNGKLRGGGNSGDYYGKIIVLGVFFYIVYFFFMKMLDIGDITDFYNYWIF